MKKRVWVLNYKIEDLQSVENISSELVGLYTSLPKDQYEVSVIELMDAERASGSKLRVWIQKFKERTPEQVVVVHPSVNHHIFFKSLLSIQSESQFIFHVFGNFVRNGSSWCEIAHLLDGKNVHFAVASSSYLKVMENFLASKSLALVPFPVKCIDLPIEYMPDYSSVRILYAGRYHEQKNVTFLIEKLSALSLELNKKITLTLVVSFDDFNPTTLNEPKKLGNQFKKYQEAVKKCTGLVEIKLFQHTGFEKLASLYKESDLFISFSTFLDEDYGCAVLESLCSGTPCLVTSWGGYQDFVHIFPEFCQGIKVEREGDALFVDLHGLSEKIKTLADTSVENRKLLAKRAQSLYGKEALLQMLEKLFERKNHFSCFHEKLNGPMSVDSFKIIYRSFWEN